MFSALSTVIGEADLSFLAVAERITAVCSRCSAQIVEHGVFSYRRLAQLGQVGIDAGSNVSHGDHSADPELRVKDKRFSGAKATQKG